jgi:uncharacterized membrane protein YgcG
VKTFTTALELWSQKRDADISRANLNVARSLRQVPDLPINSLLDVWLWYPAFGSFIYMPGSRYRSPYGYSYQAVGEIRSYGGGFSAGSGGGGGSNANAGGGSSNSNASSGGGGAPVGFSSSVPASTGASSPTPSAGAQAGASTGGHSNTTLGK